MPARSGQRGLSVETGCDAGPPRAASLTRCSSPSAVAQEANAQVRVNAARGTAAGAGKGGRSKAVGAVPGCDAALSFRLKRKRRKMRQRSK